MLTSRILCLMALSSLCACARRAGPIPTGTPGPDLTVSSPSAMARARQDSLRLPYTVADIRFMTGMIGHHAQAVVMSHLVPERSQNRSVQTLAERIINAQEDEIVIMQRWLRDRGHPAPDAKAALAAHAISGHSHDMPMSATAMDEPGSPTAMPGMLSPAQLAQLDSARGSAFDTLFLTFMMQHHSGAVSMVQDLFSTPAAGQDETVFKFASDVHVDQTTEIARMRRLLVVLKLHPKSP